MDYWIGKQYLYIPDIINSAMSSPIDWLMEQPLMAYIADTPGVKFLDDLLALGRQNGMIIPDIAVATIQSAWGINKASNTRIGDMNWLANDSLNNSSVNMNSQKVYPTFRRYNKKKNNYRNENEKEDQSRKYRPLWNSSRNNRRNRTSRENR